MKLDTVTTELPGIPPLPKGRGRPATGEAMTHAERQRRYREKMRAMGLEDMTVTVTAEVRAALAKHVEFKDVALGEVVDRILRAYLLRKR